MAWKNKIISYVLLLIATTATIGTAVQESSEIVKTSLELTNDEEHTPIYSTDNPTSGNQQQPSSPEDKLLPYVASSADSNNRPLSSEYKSWPSSSSSNKLFPKNGGIPTAVIPKENNNNVVIPYTNVIVPAIPVVKEANSQYQYQINSRYEEKTRPEYWNRNDDRFRFQQQQQPAIVGGPTYRVKDDSQIQVQGKSQRRTETNVLPDIRVGSPESFNADNPDLINRQRYSEFGNGETSPDYNSYLYKRIYY